VRLLLLAEAVPQHSSKVIHDSEVINDSEVIHDSEVINDSEVKNDSDVFNRVRDVLCETLNVKPEEVVPEAAIKDDLGAESLDLVSVIAEFEDTFDTEFSDEDMAKLITVADAVTFIQTTLAARTVAQ
jgi:acyl carrier protein